MLLPTNRLCLETSITRAGGRRWHRVLGGCCCNPGCREGPTIHIAGTNHWLSPKVRQYRQATPMVPNLPVAMLSHDNQELCRAISTGGLRWDPKNGRLVRRFVLERCQSRRRCTSNGKIPLPRLSSASHDGEVPIWRSYEPIVKTRPVATRAQHPGRFRRSGVGFDRSVERNQLCQG